LYEKVIFIRHCIRFCLRELVERLYATRKTCRCLTHANDDQYAAEIASTATDITCPAAISSTNDECANGNQRTWHVNCVSPPDVHGVLTYQRINDFVGRFVDFLIQSLPAKISCASL
jgi:hypothetical protein